MPSDQCMLYIVSVSYGTTVALFSLVRSNAADVRRHCAGVVPRMVKIQSRKMWRTLRLIPGGGNSLRERCVNSVILAFTT